MPLLGKSHKPFEQIDLKGGDLELGTLSRLQHSPDTSGVELFLRSTKQRQKGTTDIERR